MAERIFMTSLKGGTGVTTCAVGLALALSAAGERTLVVDGDDRCACALSVAGVSGLQVYTLADAEKGACRVKQTLLQHPRSTNFYLLPSLGCKNKSSAADAVKEIEGLFDFILCDKIASSACNRAVAVTDPYPASLKSADACLSLLKDSGFKNVGLMVNKANGGLVFDGEIMTPQEIAALLHAPLLAVLPEDLSLPLGRWKGSSIKAFRLAAERISGKSDKVLSIIRPYLGVGGLIKRKMRSKI